MGLSVRLTSDFKDFYDEELNKLCEINKHERQFLFRREKSQTQHRALDLKFLRTSGIPTIDLKPVTSFQFMSPDTKILVYTQPELHNGLGKVVMDNLDAQTMYGNMPAREWIKHSETNGMTLKCLQVGLRRFKILLWNESPEGCIEESGKGLSDLKDKKVVSVEELPGGQIGISASPIYSIDYLPTDAGLLATDYNSIENLGNLGFERVMTPSEICKEIIDFYNIKYS